MILEHWRYKISTTDAGDLWSYIQFTPENGFNPAWKIQSHLILQPSNKIKPMFIRQVGMHVVVGGPSVPHIPVNALFLSMHLMPNIMEKYGEADLGLAILQGTQGPTNWLFANFPRSLYMDRGLVVYVPTITVEGNYLEINILWEPTGLE